MKNERYFIVNSIVHTFLSFLSEENLGDHHGRIRIQPLDTINVCMAINSIVVVHRLINIALG